jgi:hypothetical protein
VRSSARGAATELKQQLVKATEARREAEREEAKAACAEAEEALAMRATQVGENGEARGRAQREAARLARLL